MQPIYFFKLFRYKCFLFFFLSLSCAQAQEEIDSLKKVLTTTTEDTVRLRALNLLADMAPDGEWEAYNNELLLLAEQKLKEGGRPELVKLYKEFLGNAYLNKGILSNEKGNKEQAMTCYEKSLRLRREIGDERGIAHTLNNIGYLYAEMGSIRQALEYYHQSLRLYEKIGFKRGMAQCLSYIGIVYKEQGDFDKTEKVWLEALKLREEIGNMKGISESYNNLATVYSHKGDEEKSLAYLKKSLVLKKELGDNAGSVITLLNIAKNHQKKKKFADAMQVTDEAEKLSRAADYKRGLCRTMIMRGQLELDMGHPDKALAAATAGLNIASEQKILSSVIDGAELLYRISKQQGKGMEALKYHELYISTRDSVNSEENKKAGIQRELQYEYEKKTAADSVRNAEAGKVKDMEIQSQKAQIEKDKTQRYALSGGLALVFLFAGFMYNRFKVTQKQKHVIEVQKERMSEQKMMVEEKQKEIIDSINYAQRIQNAILAKEEDIHAHFPDSFLLYKPKHIVAGDFYFFEATDTHVFYAAADCTGHGVPGALVSVICANALSRCVKEFGLSDPGKILDKTRELVLETFRKSGEIKDGMDISLLVKDRSRNTFSWAGANNPLYIIRDSALTIIPADKQPIGYSERAQPFTTIPLDSIAGSSVYLFTDGYADQFGGPKGKKFKYRSLQEKLISLNHQAMAQQRQVLDHTFEDWKGNLEQVDDMLLIGLAV